MYRRDADRLLVFFGHTAGKVLTMEIFKDPFGWLQLSLFLGLLLRLTRPMGIYLFRVLDMQGKTFLDPVVRPVERCFYFLLRVDPKMEQDWKQYTISMLAFSLGGTLFTYAILRIQHLLIFQD
jgi:K+-transporting ATPase ATPase A chain